MTEETQIPCEKMIEVEMTLKDALTKVCKVSRTYCKLYRGSKETVKKMYGGKAILALISKEADKKLVELASNIAKKKDIPIITVDTNKELSQIVGQYKTTLSGKEKNAKCALAAIGDFCETTPESIFVEEALKAGNIQV